ncbi:MAG: Gfo/Idh/MocA family oxidoreductase [Lachnospiraceae bacterium]|nr:Gfo/Idh/MocA family oxidoreductase [Lachnospiraceae bacterium]MCI9341790.1 Gfo/Idh/MocA family oxidoreductase [Lachnospiraceae bacterium]
MEMLVILTPAPTHYELIRRGLMAGKHVYTEKTMTVAIEGPARKWHIMCWILSVR